MCQCLEGDKVDWENLKTPEQQNMMESLYYQMMKGGQQGATQFPGQLSAPMTDMQKMAAKTQAGVGGFGWEQQSPKYRSVPNMYNPENINNLPVRGASTTTNIKTTPGPPPPRLEPYDTSGIKQPGLIPPGPPGPGPGPKPIPEEMIQLLMAMGMGGGSNYDPRNIRRG